MKKLITTLALCALVTSFPQLSAAASTDGSYTTLKQDFVTPPDDARPRVWWHWMNGNITREGLFKDLDWLYGSGVRGVHIFDANFTTPQIVDHRVSYLSDEWKGIFRDVVARADSLGMEVTIASSPGFSSSGGPWVSPEDAMKKLTWRQVDVEGGAPVEIVLPEPYDVTGVYQNIARESKCKYYKDIAVLAVRIPEAEKDLAALEPAVTSSSGRFTFAMLNDGDCSNGAAINAGPEGYSWIQYAFPEPVTVHAVTIRNGRTRGERHSNPAVCPDSLQYSDDGISFHTAAGLPLGSCLMQTVDIEPVTARYFRLKHANVPDSYDYVTDSWTRAPESTVIHEFSLHTVTKVNHSQEKAGFGGAHDLRLFPTPDRGPDHCSPAAIDVSRFVRDGVLCWDAPQGRWRIFRFGCSLTGKVNHPASEEATGLEVDKLDPDAWTRYFCTYLQIMKEAAGGLLGERGIQYVLEDSYEAELQTWTPAMREQFLSRRGYDCLPWLPALTGIILESAPRTEQFLRDWRATLGELFSENYARLTDLVRDRFGMKGCYIEAHANGCVFPVDGMAVKKTASFPMGEMWIQGKVGNQYRVTEGTTDIRESASTAHIYGRQYVAAESMTAIGLARQAWSYCPENMKRTADLELKCGVNRFVLHDSAAQPRDDKFPGLGLGVYGHWYNRHECWAGQAGVWMDYLARSSYMLSRGLNVADVLWYYGEESNITAFYSRTNPEIPRGYEFDYIGAEALLGEISCDNGILRAASGVEYRVLYIDPHVSWFSDEMREKLEGLRRSGAVICGTSFITGEPGLSLQEGLAAASVTPDVYYEGDETLNWRHRRLEGGVEIYWLNNPRCEAMSRQVSFRVNGKIPHIWHPEDASVEKCTFFVKDGRTCVDLDFVSDDAFFLVFADEADPDADEPVRLGGETLAVDTGWEVQFQKGRRAPDRIRMKQLRSLSESEIPGVRYFSGTAAYSTRFRVEHAAEYSILDLGDVKNIAEVWLNGEYLGTCWKSPFRINVQGKLREGRNSLEVRVTNTWPNRLIGDKQPEESNPLTYTAFPFYKADDPLLPSGLIGPVRLLK